MENPINDIHQSIETSMEIPIETKTFKIKDYDYQLTDEWRLISYSKSSSIVFKSNIRNISETDNMSIVLKLLKTDSQTKNLFYEFLVGLIMNDMKNIYFAKSLYFSFFSNEIELSRLREKLENQEIISYQIDREILKYVNEKKLPEKTMSFKSVLNNSIKVSNLLEMIKGYEYDYVFKTDSLFIEEYIGDKVNLLDILLEKKGINNGLLEILNILYIVYSNLYKYREIFSHNNLTKNKVLLQYSKNSIYEIETKRGKILTKIRPVIIDYSQAYCKEIEDLLVGRDLISDLTKDKIHNKNSDLLYFKQVQELLIANKNKIKTTNKTKELLETLLNIQIVIDEKYSNETNRDFQDKTIYDIMNLYILLEDLTYDYNFSDLVDNSLETIEIKMFY
jgi:hypothetical protein